VSGLAATAILLFTVFAARTYIAGLDYTRALRANGEPGLLGFDQELARRYTLRPLSFFKDAAITSSLGVLRRHHAEPELERRRVDYLIGVIGMVVSFVLIWPLW
jgi:hypothetical protein